MPLYHFSTTWEALIKACNFYLSRMAIHLRPRQLTAQKSPCFPLRVGVKQLAHQVHTSGDTWGLVVTM